MTDTAPVRHLVTEWGDRDGVQHRECRGCGTRGDGPDCEQAVAACRATETAAAVSA